MYRILVLLFITFAVSIQTANSQDASLSIEKDDNTTFLVKKGGLLTFNQSDRIKVDSDEKQELILCLEKACDWVNINNQQKLDFYKTVASIKDKEVTTMELMNGKKETWRGESNAVLMTVVFRGYSDNNFKVGIFKGSYGDFSDPNYSNTFWLFNDVSSLRKFIAAIKAPAKDLDSIFK